MREPIELGPGEQIILVVHKHWFVFLARVLGLALTAIIPLAALFIFWFGNFLPDLRLATETSPADLWSLAIFLGAGWFLIIWMMLGAVFADYYLDAVILTNQRLLDIEQFGFFARDLATLPHQNIQDIKVEIFGFFPTLLHYGDLHIQTAGMTKEARVRDLPQPEKIKEAILKLILPNK